MRRLLAALLLFVGLPAWAAVNINTADVSELETLPGIGPSKAAAIVQYRADNGPFKSVDDLDNVAGIGPSTLASLRDLVTVGDKGASGSSASAAASSSSSSSGSGATTSTGSTATSSGTTTSSASSSSAAGCPVNINAADAGALENLPGIGASKAAAILQYRVDNGPYKSCDELDNVSGIGPATIAGLADCCTVK